MRILCHTGRKKDIKTYRDDFFMTVAVSNESGKGQPRSKTLSRRIARDSYREVLECGCPLPL